jgi:hypothetical protein
MANDLKLICEHDVALADNLELIIEDSGSGKKIYKVRGPYIIAEEKNANGRVYDANMMAKCVDEYVAQYIDTKRSIGEMNHPDSVEVDFNNACHMITSLKREGNIWIGESKILTGTPKGDLYAALIENGVSTGMSTRGVGNVNSDNRVDEFKLVAVDVVANPSGPGAFVDGILESRNFLIDTHGEIVERAFVTLDETLAVLPSRSTEKASRIMEALTNFITDI